MNDIEKAKILSILFLLKNIDCFCDVGIDNPMLKGEHTEICKKIMEYIKELNEI